MVRVIQSRIDEAHELTNCIVNMNESTVVALTYLKIYIDSVKPVSYTHLTLPTKA